MSSRLSILSGLVRDNKGLLIGGLILGIFIITMGYFVLLPSYLSPATKMYSSNLGYPAMMRRLGKPLPVTTAQAGEREFTRYVMGEGVCSSDPVLVPVIPLSSIEKIHFKEGDYVGKGEIMAELSHEFADIKLASAQLAVATAKAELARVESGSAYVLAQERPKMESVNLAAEKERYELATEKVDRMRKAYQAGLVAKTALLDAEKDFADSGQQLSEAVLRMGMAEEGVIKSLEIARNAVRDAEEAVAHRQLELKNYLVRAPASGIIERVLIKEGEYNPDPGKPGFVIVSGLWFDAFFDQADFGFVRKDETGEVRLEAYPGVSMPAIVERLTPVVSFNEGGPEISRPLRPRGSGAPEWAATFRARLQFTEKVETFPIAMGMTGFGRLTVKRKGIAIPRAALLSISAGAGVVYLPGPDQSWEAREVKVGIVDDQSAEILSGIEPDEKVIVTGHWILREGDLIEITKESEFDYQSHG